MLIFFADGRLGNQIFQYAFLKTIAKKNETLIIYNFDSIIDVFDILRRKKPIIKRRRYLGITFKLIVRPFLILLSKIRLISLIQQDDDNLDGYKYNLDTYTKKGGLLPFTFVDTSFFQSEKFFDYNAINNIIIKSKHLKKQTIYWLTFQVTNTRFSFMSEGEIILLKLNGAEFIQKVIL